MICLLTLHFVLRPRLQPTWQSFHDECTERSSTYTPTSCQTCAMQCEVFFQLEERQEHQDQGDLDLHTLTHTHTIIHFHTYNHCNIAHTSQIVKRKGEYLYGVAPCTAALTMNRRKLHAIYLKPGISVKGSKRYHFQY